MPRARDTGQKTLFFETIQRLDLRGLFHCGRLRRHIIIWSLKKDAGMPRLFRSVPKKLTEMQHLQKRYVLLLRCKVGEIVPKRLARDEVAMSVLSCPNPRAYDRREEQTIVARSADMR